jgi:hypothetical protein
LVGELDRTWFIASGDNALTAVARFFSTEGLQVTVTAWPGTLARCLAAQADLTTDPFRVMADHAAPRSQSRLSILHPQVSRWLPPVAAPGPWIAVPLTVAFQMR